MEKQETILEKSKSYFFIILNLFYAVIEVAVALSVIALLYVNGFVGASNILHTLVIVFANLVIIGVIVYAYIWLCLKAVHYSRIRNKKRKEEFFKEVRLTIKEEIKNGRRNSSK
jgi:uncharacterized membrane protein YdfJ with MMPL/SSD domain